MSRHILDDARAVNTPLIMISSRTADKHQNLVKEIGVDVFFGQRVQDGALLGKNKKTISSEKVEIEVMLRFNSKAAYF